MQNPTMFKNNLIAYSRIASTLAMCFLLSLFCLLAQQSAYAQEDSLHIAAAPSLALAGTVGQKAIVIMGGEPPKTMSIGQQHQGIKLVAVQSNQATFAVPGADGGTRQVTIQVGQVPLSLGSTGGGSSSSENKSIILTPGRGGHYFPTGYINNRAVTFMLDTGASSVAMSAGEAARLGIKTEGLPQIRVSTANGVVNSYEVTLDSVRIQGVEVRNVRAGITEAPMPYILLGNSFLNRFDITRTHDRMELKRRY